MVKRMMKENELEGLVSRQARRNICKCAMSFVLRGGCALVIFAFATIGFAYGQDWGKPVWSDEFNSNVPGAPPDTSNWTYEVGGNGWGNHELEIYCAAGGAGAAKDAVPAVCNAEQPNAFQDGQGHLIIRAARVSTEPAPMGTWTSAESRALDCENFNMDAWKRA